MGAIGRIRRDWAHSSASYNGNEHGDTPPPTFLLHFCHLLDMFQLRVKFHRKFMRNDITRESPEAKATPVKAKRLSENLLN